MAYADPEPRITWDRPGLFQGVTLEREIDGTVYAERIPHNGLVSQALAARLLGVSLMSVNNWVNDKKIRHIKVTGQPSAIPLSEVKRVRQILAKERRLRGGR
jgi:excisionase family DNA binding protein